MPHRNAPLTETDDCGWPVAWSRTVGRCAAPPNASRSRPRQPSGGRTATASSARPGWLIGPAARQHPRRRRPQRPRPPGRQQNPQERRLQLPPHPRRRSPPPRLSEIHADEKKETAAAFWTRAQEFFTTAGITVERVLTDDGSCYRSRDWRDALTRAGITHERTRPYRPQTNGKAERFNRTLLDEWAYARPYWSEAERREAFPGWLHTYNHHRGHTALAGQPPASRVPNLTGQYT
ncbi:hypothetical protein GCM10010103_75930 [Streptomyces paradoxus]